MISIIEHIEYLVLRHDCVVVPGLGALIAPYSASIDSELECIFPPRRSITFNAELVHNDGLLVSSVARRHRLTYDQAAQIVTDCVNAMHYQLQQEGETGLGHLGYCLFPKKVSRRSSHSKVPMYPHAISD